MIPSLIEPRVTEFHAPRSRLCKRLPRARGNHCTLLLRQCRINVQHEWIDAQPKVGHHERHPLRHKTGNEVNIAAEAVELAHENCRLTLLRKRQSRSKPWTTIQGITALPRFDLHLFGNDGDVVLSGEPLRTISLSIETKPAPPLPGSRNAAIEHESRR